MEVTPVPMLTRSTNCTPQTAPSTLFTFKFGLTLLLVPLVSVGGRESVSLALVVATEFIVREEGCDIVVVAEVVVSGITVVEASYPSVVARVWPVPLITASVVRPAATKAAIVTLCDNNVVL